MVTQQRGVARHKHIPQRMCIACRQTAAKRQLVRLVRTSQGAVEVDTTGKRAGRGAYICYQRGCWDVAINKGRLEKALKTALTEAQRATLLAYSRTLPLIETD